MTPETFAQIIQDVESGLTMRAALDKVGTTYTSLYRFRDADPTRRTMLARARQDGAFALVDQALAIVDDELDPQRARVRAELRLKVAGKFNQAELGDKVDLTVAVASDPAALHLEGMRRARLMRDQPALLESQPIEDAVVVQPEPTDKQSVPAASPSIFD